MNDRDDRLVRVLTGARGGSRMERYLFALGGALALMGVVVIIVGWVGTSRTVLVAGQIPYVVSGGILGLALVFLGGFLYFGHWMSAMVQATNDVHRELVKLREERDGKVLDPVDEVRP